MEPRGKLGGLPIWDSEVIRCGDEKRGRVRNAVAHLLEGIDLS